MLRTLALALVVVLLAVQPSHSQQPRESSLRFPSGVGSLNLFMRHQAPTTAPRGLPVLILHGATFPSANAAAWRMGGRSWMDELAAAGHDVYALDFLGYGSSDRYPEMASEDPSGPPLGNIEAMVDQVGRAVDEIIRVHGGGQVNLIAHSAGTFVAGRYAELHPGRVARLVLFGAPAPSKGGNVSERDNVSEGDNVSERSPVRHFQMSAADELDAFESRVRQSGRLDMGMFPKWADTYLATDPTAQQRQPASVRIPAGMRVAFADMVRIGQLPYDPGRVTVPTLVIQGDWDEVTPPAQGMWLFEHLASPLKRFVVLSQGGHRLHLERSRFQLYRETETFLGGKDLEAAPHAVIFEVKPAGEQGRQAYLAEAAKLAGYLQAMPGFVSIERFDNKTRPGWMLSLSLWRDEAALIGWRENLDHRAAQEKGRHGIFEDYRIRVARQVTAGGDLTLAETFASAGPAAAENFESVREKGHRVALIESAGSPGTHWQVIRDYGMHDRRQAPRE